LQKSHHESLLETIFRRRSIRLKGYDYSQAGGYYVTIVTLWRECLFGEVVDSETRLNALGRIV
jgi:putative transposase